jgi:hypothetical protein
MNWLNKMSRQLPTLQPGGGGGAPNQQTTNQTANYSVPTQTPPTIGTAPTPRGTVALLGGRLVMIPPPVTAPPVPPQPQTPQTLPTGRPMCNTYPTTDGLAPGIQRDISIDFGSFSTTNRQTPESMQINIANGYPIKDLKTGYQISIPTEPPKSED